MEEQFWKACWRGDIEEIRKLLENPHININWQNNGLTPLYGACCWGYIEIVKLLLNDKRVDINKMMKNGTTPLWLACSKGHLEIVELLLASKWEVNIDAKDNNKGQNAKDIAKEEGKKEKKQWECEEDLQRRMRNCPKIVELLESFERNPTEIKFKLRKQFGLLGFFLFFSFFFLFFFLFFSFQ